MRGRLWLVWVVVGATVAMQVADLAAPLYLRTFFNTLASQAPNPEAAHALLASLGLVVAAWAASWLATRIQGFANEYLEAQSMERLYTEGFEYMMGHSYSFFVNNFAGSLTSKLARFTRSYERIFDAVVTQFFPTGLFIGGAIVVLAYHNLYVGLILAGWAAAMLLFQIYLSRINQPIRLERAEADTRVTGMLSDAIANQHTVALFSGARYETGRFAEAVRDWRRKTLRAWVADSWIWGSLALLMIAVQGTLLWAAVHFWLRGLLTLGDFVLIQAYLLTTLNRLMGINWQLRGFYDALADAHEMLQMLMTPHEVRDARNARHLAIDRGVVWFDDVSFGFHDKAAVLHQFNLTIDGGERVALVGPSGAGKSTVTKLLLRLYDVASGEIKIDGQDISKVTQESLRDAIAFVPQEPILFHRTLMENIRYGWRDATDEQVVEAAKRAHCHEFISRLPQGYDTYVGERGVKLSGGERQRVAIARAILKDAPILVLDEATSSLDSQSEALIQDALETLMKGKTVIVIAHRLSTIMRMDRIVVMEKGGIVAQGTHLQLVNERGLYQRLWSIQAGGFIGGSSDDEGGMSENGAPQYEKLADGEEE